MATSHARSFSFSSSQRQTLHLTIGTHSFPLFPCCGPKRIPQREEIKRKERKRNDAMHLLDSCNFRFLLSFKIEASMLAPDEATSMLGEPRSRSAFSHPFFFSGFSFFLLFITYDWLFIQLANAHTPKQAILVQVCVSKTWESNLHNITRISEKRPFSNCFFFFSYSLLATHRTHSFNHSFHQSINRTSKHSPHFHLQSRPIQFHPIAFAQPSSSSLLILFSSPSSIPHFTTCYILPAQSHGSISFLVIPPCSNSTLTTFIPSRCRH